MERHPLHDFTTIGLFLAVPLLLIFIQAQLPPAFYPWISSLPQFAKCLIAPFVSFGWPYLLSNLIAYTILAGALLIMTGRHSAQHLAYQFLIALVAVPLVTATVKTAVAYPGTGLGFSGVTFAMTGILAITLIQAAPKDRLAAGLAVTAGVLTLAAVLLLAPPVAALPDGRIFYTDVVGHWCGFLVGCGTALVYPLSETRREWIGVLALAYFAVTAVPMIV